MAKKMLIDATHPEETRVVVVDGQKVEDFDFESITKRQLAGNIYLAKVTRVEPSLQAAFVEYGGNRHGFLAFSEIHPDYYQIPIADREALLEEEAREEEERRDREETADEEKPRKSRRGRGRKKADTSDAEGAAGVAGLEVIDIDGGDGADTPNGFEVAVQTDAESDETGAEGQLVSLDPAGDDVIVSRDREDDDTPDMAGPTPETVETEAPSQDQATDPEEVTEPIVAEDDPETPPKSIAESAGLEDEERLTEEIDDASSARTVTAEDATPDAAETASDAGDRTDVDSFEAEALEGSETASPGDEGSAESTAQAADGTGDADAADEEKSTRKPRRKRRTRSRKSDDKAAQDASETDADESDQPEEAVESIGAEDTLEEAARARTRLRRKYKIQDVVKVRQILLVQVVKEERGNKGAALTTYLSLAGRYCVLMPNTARGGGISRKITNASDRKRLREITGGLDVPQGMGLIVRTAGAERTKAEIKRDYEFLIRQWEQIRERTLQSIAPALIYEEGSLIKRSIRDVYSKEIDQVLVEGETGYREAKEYMKMLMPSHAKNVQPYTDQIPLFSRYQVESYLNGMFNPTVQLKSGGYIVIGVTEALVAIDVNSGRATKQGSIEETALQTNLEAADEVARQLRLRDLAGLIVIDFIDMDENRNNRAVEKRMKDRLKNDRARIQVGRISAFGLMEMSRQRLRPGMLEATTQPCPHCMGVGLIRSDENMSLSILREVEEEALRGRSDEVTVRAPLDVANYLINHKRETIKQIEDRHEISIIVLADPSLVSPNYEIDRSKTAPTRKPSREVEAISASSVGIEDTETTEETHENENRSRRRRGKRGGKRKRGGDGAEDQVEEASADTEEADSEDQGDENGRSRRGRGRRRGGRGRKGRQDGGDQQSESTSDTSAEPSSEDAGIAPAETLAEDAPDTEVINEPVTEVPEQPIEAVADQPTEPVAEQTVEHVTAGEETVVETTEAEDPVQEQAAPVEPERAAPEKPEEPPRPKKRGWWSFGG